MICHFDQKLPPQNKPVALSPQEAYHYLQDGAALIDIRPEYETSYRLFDFPNVYLIPFDTYKEACMDIPQNQPVIIVDNVGLKSPKVGTFLIEQGYSLVAYIIGGVVDWEKSGLPIVKDFDYELHGGCACMLKSKK